MLSIWSTFFKYTRKAGQTKCLWLMVMGCTALFLTSCAVVSVNPFSRRTDSLREFTLQGKGHSKILIIPVTGIISDANQSGFLFSRPSMLQEIVSMLRKAEKDNNIKAVILKVNSPGGSTTASDILYNEILRFKQKTGVKIVVSLMDVAASGGYYISLPADYIVAHPTSVTGSVGVIFMRPQISGLMEKIGLNVYVEKSGDKKDMGSLYREPTQKEEEIFSELIRKLGQRFLDLVAYHRKLDQASLSKVASGRIYHSEEALKIGLVDKIGYLNDAFSLAKKITHLSQDSRIVVYRRIKYPDDNLYNTSTSQFSGGRLSLINMGLFEDIPRLHTGFYYLWPTEAWK